MSKKKAQNDKPYAYINKAGKGEAPVTFTQLVKLVHADVLEDDDQIRRQNESEWKRVADADWLMYLPEPQADSPSPATETPSVPEPRPRKQRKGGSKGLVITAIATATVIVLGVAVWMLMGGVGGNPEDDAQDQAVAYVERELQDWRAGQDTDLCMDVRRPILLSYEIVNTQPKPRYNANGPQRFDITVQLTFSSAVGGRPVDQHTFTVEGDPETGEWKLSSVPYLNL